jgi:hypothetical protein
VKIHARYIAKGLLALWMTALPVGAGRLVDLDLTKHLVGVQPKDGIPALTNPDFVDPAQADYLAEDDLILGVSLNGEAKAYPENLGWRHEIINDQVGGRYISVTFCPLTGTGLVFDATDEAEEQFQLRVSGLLINSNLVMYDFRDKETLYPQMTFTGLNGSYKDQKLTLLPVIETTWAMWKRMHPESDRVPDPLTGWPPEQKGRTQYPLSSYQRYPYFSTANGDYRRNDEWLLYAPSTNGPGIIDNRLPLKDIVLGICWNDQTKAYPFNSMPQDGAVINDRVDDLEVLVIFDAASKTAIPYRRRLNGQVSTFYEVEPTGPLPVEFRDVETGTRWNMLGQAIAGPLRGESLEQIPAYNSMWFAWAAYWPETLVWQGEGIVDMPILTVVEEDRTHATPSLFSLAQNYPNPFNPETRIQYALPAADRVRLTVYDALGQAIRTLVDTDQQPGVYSMSWDGRDHTGKAVASGTYHYRLELRRSGQSLHKYMVLVR